MAKKQFDIFWDNHPSNQEPPVEAPCMTDGEPNFPNECCIRFGAMLAKSGINLKTYTGEFCWYKGHPKHHTLRVEEMKLWLNSKHVKFVKKAEISKRSHGRQKTWEDYEGKRGIICFRNFWGDNNQGDHIDLWDGKRISHGSNDYFERSEEIWYWKME
jgi:Type VI secretion system (T6SS), amidase effector protein 4